MYVSIPALLVVASNILPSYFSIQNKTQFLVLGCPTLRFTKPHFICGFPQTFFVFIAIIYVWSLSFIICFRPFPCFRPLLQWSHSMAGLSTTILCSQRELSRTASSLSPLPSMQPFPLLFPSHVVLKLQRGKIKALSPLFEFAPNCLGGLSSCFYD